MFSYLTKSIVRLFNFVMLCCIVIGLAIFSVIICTYNYKQSITDLTSKAANSGNLAAISLKQPLWNFDNDGMRGIVTAIMLDKDVIAIRVKNARGQAVIDQSRETGGFEKSLHMSHTILSNAKIFHEGQEIGQVQILTSMSRAMAAIQATTLLISIFAIVFIIVIFVCVLLLGRRIIKRPINELRASADNLAAGNLDEVINTARHDELGSLASSFDKMRNAIRKKLADLAILNSTGEALASIHDQTLALETTIRIMNQQTNVQRGSIYLLNSEHVFAVSAHYPEMTQNIPHIPKTFMLGEGVVGVAAETGKIQFLPDTSKDPHYVSSGASEKPVALLCVPLLDDKEVFGVMNFIGEVGKVTFSMEDEGFALTIARMIVITIKNIQMLAVIEQHNRTLEEKILQRTAELRQKTNDVNNMLQNMQQGIFTIMPGGSIHPEHSAYLSAIFETQAIAQQPALHFLFDNSDVGQDALSQIEASMDSIIGEDPSMFEFNSHLLVKEYTRYFPEGRSKILELDWNPVLDGDTVDKLMVTVRDVTELKALQRETEKQKEELQIIGQILAVSRDKFMEFIKTSYDFCDENQALIESTHSNSPEVVAVLFRNMHTIKGNARTYGLTYITDLVHQAETTYNQLRADPTLAWDAALLSEELMAVRKNIAHYATIFKDKLSSFIGGDADDTAKEIIEKIAHVLEEVNETSPLDLKESLHSIKNSINVARSTPLSEVLKGILNSLPSIAKQLDKEAPVTELVDRDIRLLNDIVPVMRNVFMHLFRNSMDHGLETSEQRLAAGKPLQGKIHLDAAEQGDELVFTFSDDGRGLALDKIRDKAIANQLLTPDQQVPDQQLAELIFVSGLSTAQSVSDISGRGVGMDAIKKFLNKYGGDVRISLVGSQAVNGYRPFKMTLALPVKFAVSLKE